ncbi:MAG: glycosyltransferase family 4 protein [Candidatus Pacebacteria bacterium]|nr:glycosyltransferase family 4 protein [Candidatus Paceibacterota bacterium]
MKLLILTQKMDSSDSNLGFFHRWVEAFAKRCESIIVICLYEGTHNLPKNVRVMSLGKEEGVSRIKYLWRFYSYIWTYRAEYDNVFVHMNQIYVVLGGLLWRLLNKRIGLWYAHGAVSFSLRLASIMTNSVFTSTTEGFRIDTKKRRVVGQGIDTDLFTPKENYTLVAPARLVTLGRITPSKNIDMMIDTLAALLASGMSATLDVVGSPDQGNEGYLAVLREHTRRAGLDNAVHFVGGVPYQELPKLLLGYDLFINAGKTGSLDKAVLDAAAAGLPVVSSNPATYTFLGGEGSVGGCDMTVKSLTDAVARVISLNETDRAAFGAQFRRRVIEEHGLPRLVDLLLRELV